MNSLRMIKSSYFRCFPSAHFSSDVIRKSSGRRSFSWSGWNKMLATGVVAFTCFSLFTSHQVYSDQISCKKSKLLCVLYDAGETGGLLPVLKKLDVEGIDFQVLVMGTAETIVTPGMFGKKRLTLKDLEITTTVDATTPRTTTLAKEVMAKFQQIDPKVVLVGAASKIQQQVVEQFPSSTTVVFIDNFSYDKTQEAFATVNQVQSVAKHVLCPSSHTRTLFEWDPESLRPEPLYHIVGKPSLEVWEKEIALVNRDQVLEVLNFTKDRPIVTLIGGYGPGYEIINPLFAHCAERLEKEGFQVVQQPHPKVAPQKVKTIEALAISQYVIGYNSSVPFDAATIGIHSLFFIPNDSRTQFTHFAIDSGLISKVSTIEELLEYMNRAKEPCDIRQAIGIPQGSTEIIKNLLVEWME